MSDFTVTPFRAEHALAIPDMEEGDISKQYLDGIEKLGSGFTLLVDNGVVVSVVFIGIWKGLAEVLMFVSQSRIAKNRQLAFKLCRDNIDRVQKEHKWRRIQSNVRASSKKNIRWAEHLGFSVESTKKAFGPAGEDFLEMVRICEL